VAHVEMSESGPCPVSNVHFIAAYDLRDIKTHVFGAPHPPGWTDGPPLSSISRTGRVT